MNAIPEIIKTMLSARKGKLGFPQLTFAIRSNRLKDKFSVEAST